ncbi:MAG: 7-cyano-7-deazaguanine synthase QueC [Crenarchaeota archaeon]|nr:7-cyano-7-deazaguanine synthase QueC [Thermoproteota archaeon]
MTKKCVIVLSGGLDSTTVAYWAKSQKYKLHALTFKYGQIANREINCAIEIATQLCASIKIIDFSSLKEIYSGVTSLVDEKIPLTKKFSHPIVVPFRNAIFLSTAVAYAQSIDAKHIFYGAQGSDANNYPDCRKEFYKAFEKAAQLGTESNILIEAPFSNVTKAELLLKGVELKVPFNKTWSCYREGDFHCGECESCLNRKKAFKEAKIEDPTKYEK